MKTFSGFLALLLIVVLACGASRAEPATAEQVLTCATFVIDGQEIDGAMYDYVLLADQSVRIVKCYDAVDVNSVPEALDGHRVSEIGEHAYAGSWKPIRTLFIPDCVTTVCPNAFGDVFTRLTLEISATHPTLKVENGMLISLADKRIIRGGFTRELTIPEGIEAVDDHAFWGCIASSVYIPASVKQLGRNPFAFCCADADTYFALQSVDLSPDNTALEISDGALFSRADRRLVWCFARQTAESYTIPDGTAVIDDFAFQRWYKIWSIMIPASVTQVGINPFLGRRSLEGIQMDRAGRALRLENGMLISTADRRLVSGSWSNGMIAVRAGIETIGDFAFRSTGAQYQCIVILPDSVTVIGRQAFAYAESAMIYIPAGVRRIGNDAFTECTGITELPEFSGGLTIGEGAFYNCTGITRLSVRGGDTSTGENASRIGTRAFANCSSLESVTLGEGVTAIGDQAFYMCGSLSEVSLPESLRSIGRYAFLNSVDRVYEPSFDVYITQYFSSVHAQVPSGSYAEWYCRENGIEFSAR